MNWFKRDTAVLEKKPLEVEAFPTDNILKEALQVLGYKCIDKAAAMREVQTVLDELGYDFLDEESVLTYQAKKTISGSRERIPVYWPFLPVSLYGGEIPAFALSKAIELKKRFPSADMFVQYHESDPDPFLVMQYRGLLFYVEAWDEPEFEGRQIVPDRKKSHR